MCAEHEIRNYSLHFCAEHEIRNYSLYFRAEHEIRQNHAEHEIRNYSLHFHTELKSRSQFNHAINNKCGFKPDQLMMHDEKMNTKFETALSKIVITS